jgi:serine/threonine protein kinase
MSLSPGVRLGPYEVTAALGAGGMGEVYRARDTRLGRDVAIKILSSGVGANPERLARFEQEARAGATARSRELDGAPPTAALNAATPGHPFRGLAISYVLRSNAQS